MIQITWFEFSLSMFKCFEPLMAQTMRAWGYECAHTDKINYNSNHYICSKYKSLCLLKPPYLSKIKQFEFIEAQTMMVWLWSYWQNSYNSNHFKQLKFTQSIYFAENTTTLVYSNQFTLAK